MDSSIQKNSFACPHSFAEIGLIMPIERPTIIDLSQSEFDQIDQIVMDCAYASQNELGRLCDERAYENDLALRLRSLGLEAATQVAVRVHHGASEKTYRLDLVCNHAVYEAKTATGFAREHDAQVLNYAMLLDIRHVKLLNFRPAKVRGRLRYNPLTDSVRHQFKLRTGQWRQLTPRCKELASTLRMLLEDWGAFLETQLYEEAIVFFMGGPEECLKRVELRRGNHLLGSQFMTMHAPRHLFAVTAISRDPTAYREHLSRLLKLTGLDGIQWMNLNHHQIDFITLTPD